MARAFPYIWRMKNSLYILLLLSGILSAGCGNNKTLPYYGERDTKTVTNADGSTSIDTVYMQIPPFKFLNQDSVYITEAAFKDKIYVADFFFTSCTTICPTMHRNLKTVFDAFKDNNDVMFLSHTIDFKYDKPSRLKSYAEKLGVDGPKWQFVYGSKDEVYKLAEKSYLVAVGEDSTAKDGYIHQGYLVLIDKDRHIRGAYDGMETAQVEKLKEDMQTLLASYKK